MPDEVSSVAPAGRRRHTVVVVVIIMIGVLLACYLAAGSVLRSAPKHYIEVFDKNGQGTLVPDQEVKP